MFSPIEETEETDSKISEDSNPTPPEPSEVQSDVPNDQIQGTLDEEERDETTSMGDYDAEVDGEVTEEDDDQEPPETEIARAIRNLVKWLLLKEELRQLRIRYREDIDRQHELLKRTQTEAREHHDSFIQDMLKVAREAQNTVSGQILSETVLAQIYERNKHATLEMEKCRIVQRQLLAHLRKLDQIRKKKDQLPEGLHLVDYEQLKMENESLAEKIHARNEEIVILRKKRTSAVHALSHVREKLQFVEKDTKIVADRLDEVDQGLHQGRIDLHSFKSRCEHISHKKQRLQKSMVNILDPVLLDDLENLKDDAETTEELLAELRQRYVAVKKEMRTRTRYMNANTRAEIARIERENQNDTDSTVSAMRHSLRWGGEGNLVKRG